MTNNPNTTLWVEKKEHIAILTLHHPEKRNALSPDLLTDLYNHLTDFSTNNDVRCIVIRGSGEKAFSSGYDIGAIAVEPLSEEEQNRPDILVQALNAIKHFPYPTIAMLNGYAFGAGFNLCACCDLRIAADDISLGMTPAKIGVAYHPDGIRQFIEAFGLGRTKEIFYTAKTFHGRELLEKGFVDYMIPKSDLEDFTLNFATNITCNAPLSLKGIKQTIAMFEKNMALNQDQMDKADQLMRACFQSHDLKEGRAAFLEKRAPVFEGK